MEKTKSEVLEWISQKTKEAEERLKNKSSHLSSIKHPQKDFFIADIFDTVTFKSDIASMEYPLFALKSGDVKTRRYQHRDTLIEINPNRFGIATIHDKDIWIYCISKLMQALYEGKEISRTVRFTIYDYLVTTNRLVNGATYELTKNALDRLAGTRIKIETETHSERKARGFGLIEMWEIVEKKDGRMIRVEVTLPDWLYKSVKSKMVLSISPDYFRLRKPLDRRIYELARKHCGSQSQWKISLNLLHKKSGSMANIRKFRMNIKSLSESNELPDYQISFDIDKDMVIFKNRLPKSLIKGLLDGTC